MHNRKTKISAMFESISNRMDFVDIDNAWREIGKVKKRWGFLQANKQTIK